MLPKSTHSTRRGTARKNHVYSQASPARTGLPDSRITATAMPMEMPTAMASTVSFSVVHTP